MKNPPALLVAFVFGVIFQMIFHLSSRFWYDTTTLERGDKVILHLPENHRAFYNNCQATFIASVAVSDGNDAFVLLRNCDFMKVKELNMGTYATDIFSMQYLERAIK